MQLRFEVDNVKCGGCARTIERTLGADARIARVAVDPAAGTVVVEAAEDMRAEVAAALARLGYPEKGSVEGLRSAAAAAKSFVSCAVGRFGD
ncbi:MAG: heavy-metal-associated domain-containing protein [Burkholderiaceae bacterium]